MDTEDRRYFKQQEITLWRKCDKLRKNVQSPMIAGTQNFDSEQQAAEEVTKENFTKANSNENFNSDAFEQNTESQIQNMTREAGDGQQNDSPAGTNAE